MDEASAKSGLHPFKIGQLIADRYTVRAVIGTGGMGWVVKAADRELDGESIALKILHPHLVADPKVVARFRHEVLLSRQLSHPLIIHVHDLVNDPVVGLCIAMEFVDGISLAQLLIEHGERALPIDEALFLLTRVAEALHYAHEAGIVHRDLTPSNILVGRDGSVKLGDFGIAKSFEHELNLTCTGEALGSPHYMAPEQFEGRPTDRRTDIYAFGIIAFQLLRGRPPFVGESFYELAKQHIEQPLPHFDHSALRERGRALLELARRCCEKQPSDRPASVGSFLEDLRSQLLEGTQLELQKYSTTQNRRPKRRRRGSILAIVTAVLFSWSVYSFVVSNHSLRRLISSVLVFEHDTNIDLTPVKALFGIRGSLLRPQEVFSLIKEGEHLNLVSLFEASLSIRSRAPNEPLLTQIKDSEGSTLLHRAVELNSKELVDTFYDNGVSYSARDGSGETVATLAVKRQYLKALAALVQQPRFSPETPDLSGDFPIHTAVRNRDVKAIALLSLARVNANSRTLEGDTAMHIAAASGDEAVLGELLSSTSPNLSVQDRHGRTPLMVLLASGLADERVTSLVALLLAYMPNATDLNARDHEGRTALLYALHHGHETAATALLTNGASPKLKDDMGRDALSYAVELGASPTLIESLKKSS